MAEGSAKRTKRRTAGKAKEAREEPVTTFVPSAEAGKGQPTPQAPAEEKPRKARKSRKAKDAGKKVVSAESPEITATKKSNVKKKKKKKLTLNQTEVDKVSAPTPAADSGAAAAEGVVSEGSDIGKKRKVDEVTAPSEKRVCSEGGKVTLASAADQSAKPGVVATAPSSDPDATRDAEAYRAVHNIQVRAGCPAPIQSFRDIEEHFGRCLTKSFRDQGYVDPTPIQAQAWPILIKGEDVVAVSKTGSGKTCAFLLPALARIGKRKAQAVLSEDKALARPAAVVVTPTRELAQQIKVEADKFADAVGARILSIFGGVPKDEQLAGLSRGVDVLVTTPGRVLDFVTLNSSRGFGAVLSLQACSCLVLDEADKMLDMGFERDIRKFFFHCMKSGSPGEVLQGIRRQTLFFTATWPKKVHQVAADFTSPEAWHIQVGQNVSGAPTAVANVKQKVFVLSKSEKLNKLKLILHGSLKHGETALVFAMTQETCDMLEEELTLDPPMVTNPKNGGWCGCIHKGKGQVERDRILNTFRKMAGDPNSKDKAVLIATDVASRGLDIPGVAMVVVYDMSDGKTKATESGMEAYVHRIGRTGRAGKPGKAVAFFTPDDRGAKDLMKMLRDGGQDVPKALEDLASRS